jgi:Uma2 family endonuclease
VVQVQKPAILGPLSEPQPDIAVLEPRRDYYSARRPEPGDVPLAIEVADRSRSYDRRIKVPLYARTGIAELWIIDLAAKAIDRHRRPAAGAPRDTARLRPGQRISIGALPRVAFRAVNGFGSTLGDLAVSMRVTCN